jgi:nucleoid-associated protein YgaU
VTREHKLALIVGFALVLVLGVLISDHFSKARQVEMAGATDIKVPTSREMGASTNGARVIPEGLAGSQPPVATRPGLVPLPGVTPLPSNSDGSSGLQIAMGGSPTHPLAAVQGDPNYLPYGDHPNGPAATTPQTTPAPAPQIPLTRYDVKDGDTLYGISSKVYGQGMLWEKVRDYNKDKLGSNGTIHKGVTLLLPPKDVLLGKPYTPPAAPATAGIVQTPSTLRTTDPTAAAKPTGDFKEYVVKDGDTLTAIARKQLNNARRINDIIDANKGTLSDPESLSVGMKLRIPAK